MSSNLVDDVKILGVSDVQSLNNLSVPVVERIELLEWTEDCVLIQIGSDSKDLTPMAETILGFSNSNMWKVLGRTPLRKSMMDPADSKMEYVKLVVRMDREAIAALAQPAEDHDGSDGFHNEVGA